MADPAYYIHTDWGRHLLAITNSTIPPHLFLKKPFAHSTLDDKSKIFRGLIALVDYLNTSELASLTIFVCLETGALVLFKFSLTSLKIS